MIFKNLVHEHITNIQCMKKFLYAAKAHYYGCHNRIECNNTAWAALLRNTVLKSEITKFMVFLNFLKNRISDFDQI